MVTQTEQSARQRGVSEATCSTSQPMVGLVGTEAGCFGDDDLRESVAWDTASPELDSTPMEAESRVDSVPPAQCEAERVCTYAQVVSGQDTSVSRPTPAEPTLLDANHAKGTGRSAVQFVLPTAPVSSRPICLLRNGCPLSPFPCSNVLSGSLPESAVKAWSDLGSQYAAEISKSSALAMVTSVLVEVSQSEVDEVEKTILEIEEALKEANDFDAQDSALEGLAEMELDDDDSCDKFSPGCYSCGVRKEG